jgi:hypothetical protein
MSHLPFLLLPNNAAKQAGEEKSGQQSQSIDPFNPTSAAVSQSPTSAYLQASLEPVASVLRIAAEELDAARCEWLSDLTTCCILSAV